MGSSPQGVDDHPCLVAHGALARHIDPFAVGVEHRLTVGRPQSRAVDVADVVAHGVLQAVQLPRRVVRDVAGSDEGGQHGEVESDLITLKTVHLDLLVGEGCVENRLLQPYFRP